MGKDTSAQNFFEGDAAGKSIVKAHEKIQARSEDQPQDKVKNFRRKGNRQRRRRSSTKQAELDAMPVIPPLVVEAALLHQAKEELANVSATSDNTIDTAVAPLMEEGALHQRAKVLGLPDSLSEPADTELVELSQQNPVFEQTQQDEPLVAEKTELVHEEDELPDFRDELPDFEIVNAPAVTYAMEEAALHQRAKALGLPDNLEPHTPMAQEGVERKTTDEEVFHEAAQHQRAKVLGLPDEATEFAPSTPQPSPCSQLHSLPVLPIEELLQERIYHKDAAVLTPEDAEVVTLHIANEGKAETLKEKIVEKVEVVKAKLIERRNSLEAVIIERRNSLEESGHQARLKIDAALEKKFGAQAEKIQTEIEKARLSAISDTARIAELLQVQVGQCASELRTQQQEIMLTVDPLLNPNPFVDPKDDAPEVVTVQPELVGDNIVAQRALDAQQGLEENAHIVREKIDGALERKFGNRVEKLQLEAERAREGAIDETARAAELVQQQLGKCASSFREQLASGVAPNYH